MGSASAEPSVDLGDLVPGAVVVTAGDGYLNAGDVGGAVHHVRRSRRAIADHILSTSLRDAGGAMGTEVKPKPAVTEQTELIAVTRPTRAKVTAEEAVERMGTFAAARYEKTIATVRSRQG
jgi:hypothetical protein